MRNPSFLGRKLVSWIGVSLGLLAFFLPLVSIHAPIVGDMQWSSFNIVSDVFGSSSNSDLPSFSQVLSRQKPEIPTSSSSPANQHDIPLGIQAALSFPIAILLCYVALIVTVALLLFSYSPRLVALTSGLGLIVAVYSLIAVFLFDDALKTQMNQSFGGLESNPFSAVGAALAASIHVQPGAGVYLLVVSFICLLVAQYITPLDHIIQRPQ